MKHTRQKKIKYLKDRSLAITESHRPAPVPKTQLQLDVEAFLANGGTIQYIPFGKSSFVDTPERVHLSIRMQKAIARLP